MQEGAWGTGLLALDCKPGGAAPGESHRRITPTVGEGPRYPVEKGVEHKEEASNTADTAKGKQEE